MKIQILGTGCPKCKLLKKNTQEAVAELGIDVTVTDITDMETMMEMGMLVSPGFAIDDELIQMGKVLKTEQIRALISARRTEA